MLYAYIVHQDETRFRASPKVGSVWQYEVLEPNGVTFDRVVDKSLLTKTVKIQQSVDSDLPRIVHPSEFS